MDMDARLLALECVGSYLNFGALCNLAIVHPVLLAKFRSRRKALLTVARLVRGPLRRRLYEARHSTRRVMR